MTEDVSGPQSGSSMGATGVAPAPDEDPRRQLPLLGSGVVRERADAARNRVRVLDAAERLFADRGVASVTMDEVAAAAGVGKGTLFRRFGDKSGLAVALLDQRERELQQAMLSGPPPLGPGAPPLERIEAFVLGYVGYVIAQLDLVLMSETASPGARLRTGAHMFWRQHLTLLLTDAGTPDPAIRAELLLAGLAAEQLLHWHRDRGIPAEELGPRLAAAAIQVARA